MSRSRLVYIRALGVGLLAGAVATLVMVLLLVIGRYWLGISPPPEALPDRFAPTLSIKQFFDLFDRFGGYNGLKKFGIKSGLTGLGVAGVVVGVAYAAVVESRRSRRAAPWRGGFSRLGVGFVVVTAVALWIGSVIVYWPVLATNFRGLPPSRARFATAGGLLVAYAAYGVALVLVYRFLTRRAPAPAGEETGTETPPPASEPISIGAPIGRRAVVAAGAGAVLALPSYALMRRLYDQAVFPYDGHPYSGPGVQPIAPNDKFYTVTKNVIDPDVSKRVWGLEIGGRVRNGRRYDYDALAALPAVEQETTLMCISNKTGAGLFSNARWKGVPMRDLLDAAGVEDGAVEVLLHAADGYTDTFAIEKAMDPTTLVVYEMNGQPLPRRHGYPVRVIVPGLYGEKNVKWVTGIDVIDHDGKGFYEKQGWGPNFEIPTRSDIFAPAWTRSSKGDNFNSPFKVNQIARIRGRAFAGARGVGKVEFSTDGGDTWHPVRIDYPGTRLTWTFWSFDWGPTEAGEYTLLSRATDGNGEPQIAQTRGIVPQGATGYHRVKAKVM
jgi:DMSO/TMAO reductase YedYZ molybdopterin-dependent catalytic subunit